MLRLATALVVGVIVGVIVGASLEPIASQQPAAPAAAAPAVPQSAAALRLGNF